MSDELNTAELLNKLLELQEHVRELRDIAIPQYQAEMRALRERAEKAEAMVSKLREAVYPLVYYVRAEFPMCGGLELILQEAIEKYDAFINGWDTWEYEDTKKDVDSD